MTVGAKPNEWPIEDAGGKLAEIVRRAASEGPQTLTEHGRAAALVVAPDPRAGPDLGRGRPPSQTLYDVLMAGRAFVEGAGLTDADVDLLSESFVTDMPRSESPLFDLER